MNITKVAVIGSGVMGAGIAAHLANAGVTVDLLDIVPEKGDNRNAIAEGAIVKLLKAEPAPFMHEKNAKLIKPGNIEDHLDRLSEVQWVIEAVVENPKIKQSLYEKLAEVCGTDTLISSNTSTLPLKLLTQDQTENFKRRFLITHFFNPPRYMRLLELVTPPELETELFNGLVEFADRGLGKGCVPCNDTPGFIANRIGTFWLQLALTQAISDNLTVEQCDSAMTLFGIPKTGVFALLDLVGLDLMPHILTGFNKMLPENDRLREIASIPPLLKKMLDEGYTGRKGKGGFYRLQPGNSKKIKESINLQDGGYHVSEKYKIKDVSHRPDDLKTFLSADDPLSRYSWRVLSETLCYAAELIPEIADNIVAVDTAMRLGYNWRYGPFELIDRLGIEWFCQQLNANDQTIPELLSDKQSLYRVESGTLQFKGRDKNYHPVPRVDGILLLSDIKRSGQPILENASASLWDIGDGVVCFEFHSKMNTLDPDILKLIQHSVEVIKQNFKALVIHNEGENFSAGANLTLLAPALMQQDWETVSDIIKLGQDSYLALKYAPFPVIAAPSGLALGGGCEILLHCDAIQAHAELYTGLVEVGVGLVPGWGGCKELLSRCLRLTKRPGGPMPAIALAFETIGLAKVSKSALQAKELLYLSHTDGITMNKDRLLADAKAKALSMCENYQPPALFDFKLPGATGRAALDLAAHNLHLSGKASAYDVEISKQLAKVLTGGETDITTPLREQDILDLELDAFVHLVKQPKTLARLEHMLKTGKPLRN